MIYSVYNPGTRGYDYYEAAGDESSANVEKPGHLVSRTLGSTVEQAAWLLPVGARRVGGGAHAIGKIAVPAGARGALGLDLGANGSLIKAGLLVVSAALIWKYAGPRRRRAR